MRSTLRLLANVKQARYLEPFAPTGLTGLQTHPSPRPTLIFLYTSTLQKLKSFPESSVYRQSTEALTNHRLQIVESTKPPGFDAWLERARKAVAAEPERFASLRRSDGTYAAHQRDDQTDDPRGEEWDGEQIEPTTEGPHRTAAQEAQWAKSIDEATKIEKDPWDFHTEQMKWENEPALLADQYVIVHVLLSNHTRRITDPFTFRVAEIEKQLGAGLIEEVIQVAERENKLVDEMYNSKV